MLEDKLVVVVDVRQLGLAEKHSLPPLPDPSQLPLRVVPDAGSLCRDAGNVRQGIGGDLRQLVQETVQELPSRGAIQLHDLSIGREGTSRVKTRFQSFEGANDRVHCSEEGPAGDTLRVHAGHGTVGCTADNVPQIVVELKRQLHRQQGINALGQGETDERGIVLLPGVRRGDCHDVSHGSGTNRQTRQPGSMASAASLLVTVQAQETATKA
mmetsp:Transcript_54516/g.145472  ORF Transcript_54516/g.145472 Transcript_54516/m.145472 type:complete len:212 (+) Transcript_54516:1292-1927(+)